MQDNPQNSEPHTGLISRLPSRSLRQRRLAAMGTAAAIVVVGLGAFALLPPVHADSDRGPTDQVAANDTDTSARAPRMLENSAPFSFADLVERVSPAVVTITSETMTTDSDLDDRTKICPRRSAICSTSSTRPATPAAAQGDQRRLRLHHRQDRL